MFDLAAPWFLLLLPLPALVSRLLRPARASGGVLVVPERIGASLVAAAQSGGAGQGARLGVLLPWTIWALVVIALTGPRELAPVPAL